MSSTNWAGQMQQVKCTAGFKSFLCSHPAAWALLFDQISSKYVLSGCTSAKVADEFKLCLTCPRTAH